MQVFSPLMSRSNSRLVRVLALVLPMVVLMAGLLSQTARAENTFMITDGDVTTAYTGAASDPAEVLEEAGIVLGPDDFYTFKEEDGRSRILVKRGYQVTIDNCGQVMQVLSYGETVARLLERLGIAHEGNYCVNMGLEVYTYDGMQIEICNMVTQEQTYTKELPYEVQQIPDDGLEAGTQIVLQEGAVGEALCTVSVTYENGVEVSREPVRTQVISEPVNQVVLCGTGENAGYPIIGDGYIILQTGEVLTYTHSDVYMGTAYTSWIDDIGDITATGTFARYGAVAVDPKVIPYGTRMFIVSADGSVVYGIATAEDCGGGVKGKHIDLFFDTEDECWEFGRQDIIVYFLGEADWRGPQHRK